jgi:hypothetical protein
MMQYMKRSVHFSHESLHTVIPSSQILITEDEKDEVWYSIDELRSFRDDASLPSNEHFNGRGNFAISLPQMSYADILTQMYESCRNGSVPSPSDMKLYVKWNKLCPSGRGIEKSYAPDLDRRFKERRYNAIRAILKIQTRCQDMDPHQRAERLRKASVQLSRTMRTFARVVGMADAAAIKEGSIKKRLHHDDFDCDSLNKEDTSVKRPRGMLSHILSSQDFLVVV